MVRNDSFAQLAPSNCFCVRLSWLIVGTLRCVADQVDHAVVRHGTVCDINQAIYKDVCCVKLERR